MAVGLADEVVVLRTQLHAGNVANAQHLAVGQRADHHLFVACLFLVAATILQHILESVL